MNEPVNVYIIDDDALDCLVAKVIIDHYPSFNATSYYSVEEALAHFTHLLTNNLLKDLPAVIFLDLVFPLQDGWHFLEAFAELAKELEEACPSIYVLTCSLHKADHQRALSHPLVKGLLIKPFTYQAAEKVLLSYLRPSSGSAS